jgi:hypothetical protein
MKGTASYIYCLVQAEAPPPLANAPRGLPGTKGLRLIEAGEDRFLVAASAPLSRYGEKAIERGLTDLEWVSARALAHETVVEHFATLGTVVPMKLFTLFESDERARAHIARMRKRIDRVLSRVRDREEWGIRVVFDEARAKSAAAPRRSMARTGTSFLRRKRAERDLRTELQRRASAEVGRIFADLARRADDSLRRSLPALPGGARVLLDAAFLVPRKRASLFLKAVDAIAKKCAPRGYEVRLTGPWPPYHFVSEARSA